MNCGRRIGLCVTILSSLAAFLLFVSNDNNATRKDATIISTGNNERTITSNSNSIRRSQQQQQSNHIVYYNEERKFQQQRQLDEEEKMKILSTINGESPMQYVNNNFMTEMDAPKKKKKKKHHYSQDDDFMHDIIFTTTELEYAEDDAIKDLENEKEEEEHEEEKSEQKEEEKDSDNSVATATEDDILHDIIFSTSSEGNDYENDDDDHHHHPTFDLYNYLKYMTSNGIEGLVLLQWHSNGTLYRFTPTDVHERWFPDISSGHSELQFTKVSQYGKVALMYNSDVIKHINNINVNINHYSNEKDNNVLRPPVPLLLYTIPYDIMTDENYVLIPNPYDRMGQSEHMIEHVKRSIGKFDYKIVPSTFFERKNIIVWRGSLHYHTDEQRYTLLQLGVEQYNDTMNYPINNTTNTSQWLDVVDSFFKSNETSQNRLPPQTMASDYRYQIDIGGVSGTSWGGLRWKMCSGGLVFKVDTWSKDWWHDIIQPWVHYIPVKADLSDLRLQYEWAEAHINDAYMIAYNGQKACLDTYTASYAKQHMISIIESLPDATEEVINNTNIIFENYLDKFFPSYEHSSDD